MLDLIMTDSPAPGLRLRRTLRGHQGAIRQVGWSPDGLRLASASEDRSMTVRIWDAERGLTLASIVEPTLSLTWSPDGRWLALGTALGSVVIWDSMAGSITRTLRGDSGAVRSVVWSPDGSTLVSATDDSTMAFWQVETWEQNLVVYDCGDWINSVTWSPDGRTLATASNDSILRLWDPLTGALRRKLLGHRGSVRSVVWAPNGWMLASASTDRTIRVWDSDKGRLVRVLEGHKKDVVSVSFSHDSQVLASKSLDGSVVLWRCDTWDPVAELAERCAGANYWATLIFHPTNPVLATLGEEDTIIRIWELDTPTLLSSASGEQTIHYINAKAVLLGDSGVGKSGLAIRLVENEFHYTDSTHGARFWHISVPQNLTPDLKVELTLWDLAGQPEYRLIHQLFLDDADLALLLFDSADPADPFHGVQYWIKVLKRQAPRYARKLLVAGRSDVSPVTVDAQEIGRFMAEHELDGYMRTSAKTGEGVQDLFRLILKTIPWERLPRTTTPRLFEVIRAYLLECRQKGQNLISLEEVREEATMRYTQATDVQLKIRPVSVTIHNQLSLETALTESEADAVRRILNNLPPLTALGTSETRLADIIAEFVAYFGKRLQDYVTKDNIRQEIRHRYVSHVGIEHIVSALHQYLQTAQFAHLDSRSMRQAVDAIPWETASRTPTSPDQPRIVRSRMQEVLLEFLTNLRDLHQSLISIDSVLAYICRAYVSLPEVDAVVSLLQCNGLLFKLERTHDRDWIVLKPELVNQYASAIIQAARNHPHGIGAIAEHEVVGGNFPLVGVERLAGDDEAVVLESTVALLINHDLCFREMGLLVFPSQINAKSPGTLTRHPRSELTYVFEGSTEAIYASLVVRLSYTSHFRLENQWKYIAEFSRAGEVLGFTMRPLQEAQGELELFFADGISEFDRATFIRFVTDHLRAKGVTMQERIRVWCPKCGRKIENQDAVEARVQEGKADIACQYCDARVSFPSGLEQRHQGNRSLVAKRRELAEAVERRTTQEAEEFQFDKMQYTREDNLLVHILHLSDIHLGTSADATKYLTQLETDLRRELEVQKLEYLVLSGDAGDRATPEEYQAAVALIDGVLKRFGLDPSRVIIVPGNHDLNWDLSRQAYEFTYKTTGAKLLPEGTYIPAGEVGDLVRNEAKYIQRFTHFSEHFYKRIYSGQMYPLDYADQALLNFRPDDCMVFLGLNSAWQVDHHNHGRSGINLEALSRALNQLQDHRYDNWLKIAVFHHPVAGKQMMNNDFMELLAVNGFQVCMHGHIHEAVDTSFRYDDARGIRVIGAGTFGAAAKDQVTGVPLQYNLLELDKAARKITVYTRRKEKPDGVWAADPRWGDKKKDPKARYEIMLKQWTFGDGCKP